MSNKNIEVKEQLDRLSDELIDNIINTPDKEILKEVAEDYGDPSYEAKRFRIILEKSRIMQVKTE